MKEEKRKENIMKDIDFLPEWYKTGRRRQISYRTQCYVLGGIFVVMMVWNFVTSYSMSKANAQILDMTTRQKQSEKVSAKLLELKNELNLYHKREGLVEKIDSKINVADVLAEISYLVDERIVLSKIELVSEKIANDGSSPQANAVVRAVQSNFNTKDAPIGDVRFKVLLAGVAVDAGDVAGLICKLENSPYFCQVVLSFSRNTDIKSEGVDSSYEQKTRTLTSTGGSGSNGENERKIQVSKFQISCYLANYEEL
jgi:Tfp pilus assembly protein PilN